MSINRLGTVLPTHGGYSQHAASRGKSAPAMPSQEEVGRGAASKGKQVLIVDDNASVLSLVAELVEYMGYHCAVAADGFSALHLLKEGYYDILLTDFEMPGMNGYELALAAKQQFLDLRVIIMTGHCTDELMAQAGASKAVDGFLLKPFDVKSLKTLLNRVVQSQLTTLAV